MLGKVRDHKLGRRRRRGSSIGTPQAAVLVEKVCTSSENVVPASPTKEVDDMKKLVNGLAASNGVTAHEANGVCESVVSSPLKNGAVKKEIKREAEASDLPPAVPHKSPKKSNGAVASPAPPPKRRGRKPKQPPLKSHLITEYFPVRRSERKTSKQIEKETNDALRKAIVTASNERHLEVYTCEVKGRGIRTQIPFKKGDFVVEYKGDMMLATEGKLREAQYAQDSNIGSYIYFYHYKGRNWCVDATDETPHKGRLVNHSRLKPNLKTKVVEFGTRHHLILVAKRDIESGEELLYDYGERNAATIALNPWLVNS